MYKSKYRWLLVVMLLVILTSSQIVIAQETTSSWALDWSPDGTHLAIGRLDGTVQIKDVISEQLLIILQIHNSDVKTSTMVSLKWNPNSTKLAGADMSNKLYVWRLNDGQLLYSLIGKNTSYITDIVWSADGKRIAAVSQFDGELQIWDADSGQRLIQHNSGYLLGLDWYGNYLVSGNGNGVILFDANTGDYVRDVGIQNGQVTAVAWSPLGDLVASGGDDGTISIWNVNTGQLVEILSGHTESVTAVDWRSDGQKIVSSSYDGTVIIWNIATGDLVQKNDVGLATFGAQFSPDGKHIAYGDSHNVVQIVPVPADVTSDIRSIAWSPDGTQLAYTTNNGLTKVVDPLTNQTLITIQSDSKIPTISITWSPDGKKLATGGGDEVVHIWDAKNGLLLHTLSQRPYADIITGLTWSSDGSELAQASYSGDITVWNTTTYQVILSIVSPASIISMSLNQDNSKLAASSGNAINVWNVADGQLITKFIGHTGQIISVAWSPNSNTVASAALDNTIYTWDAATGQTLQTFAGHTNIIMEVIWSPDGTKLASASQDKSVRIWDAATGQLQNTIHETTALNAIAWSPDGSQLAYGGDDGILHIVPVFTTPGATSAPDAGNVPTPQATLTAIDSIHRIYCRNKKRVSYLIPAGYDALIVIKIRGRSEW